ncbi:hypothetical protein BH11MYX2_BH11MYX2_15850 [soil metagenome]
MATFHVYVEGADDPSPAGLKGVAQAISQRFGLSSEQLVQRLAVGRFRVKANVDRVTAESFVRALAECGARSTIEPSDGAAVAAVEPRKTSSGSMPPINVARKASPSTPPPAGPAARAANSSLPPTNRPQSGTLPAQSRTTSKNSMQSGLSAAFGGDRAQSESEFSALGSGGSLSLSSLDGDDAGVSAHEEQFAAAVKYEPPPPAPRTVTGNKSQPSAAPVDLFRPPDAEEADALVDLAADEVVARAEKADRAQKASLPPANVSGANLPLGAQRFGRVDGPVTTLQEKEPTPPGRFAAGVLLAILLGFLPAHLVASSRERSAFRQIDAEIERTQQSAVSDEDQYKALAGFRAGQLAKKEAERKSIAMMAMVIWAIAGAAVAYGFFYRVPWDKLGTKPEATV